MCETALDPRRDFVVAVNSRDYLPWLLVQQGYAVKPIESDFKDPIVFRVAEGTATPDWIGSQLTKGQPKILQHALEQGVPVE